MNSELWNSISRGDIEAFKQLWTPEEEKRTLDTTGWGFIHNLTCSGQFDCLRHMLESGIDPNSRTGHGRSTPLILSVADIRESPVTLLLLKYGGNPFLREKNDRNAFHFRDVFAYTHHRLEAYLVVELVCGEADNLPLDLWRVVKPYIV